MSDIREALVAHLERSGIGYGLHDGLKREVLGAWADAILAEFDVTKRGPVARGLAQSAEGDVLDLGDFTQYVAPRGEDRWEYGVRWGDDGTVKNYGSRDRAEGSAAESHGDKIVRRTKALTIPAGEWEVVPDE